MCSCEETSSMVFGRLILQLEWKSAMGYPDSTYYFSTQGWLADSTALFWSGLLVCGFKNMACQGKELDLGLVSDAERVFYVTIRRVTNWRSQRVLRPRRVASAAWYAVVSFLHLSPTPLRRVKLYRRGRICYCATCLIQKCRKVRAMSLKSTRKA